tara:strand:+ start:492 stop:965 length:474 start_codon:yes stop_codon:yes gene_type:complete
MKKDYLNIYNNLIKLTRNKNLYMDFKNNDTFSDRLIIFLFHFGFFLKIYKDEVSKKEKQEIFDFIIRQLELSIREVGYGDVSVNKKMKDYVNLFYSILGEIENWNNFDKAKKILLISNFINIDKESDLISNYFDKYCLFLANNTLKNFTKDILELKI